MQSAKTTRNSSDSRILEFFSRLSKAPSRTLLLDYDGTLAPFASNPAKAAPYPGVCELLRCIQCETGTRLVIVTGRNAAEIPRLLNLTGLEIWGCYGLERLRADGSVEIARVDARLLAAIETANQLIGCEGLSYLAERKTASIAIHWRGREDISGHIARRLNRIWSMIPDRDGLQLALFDGGVEIRLASIDKGTVVRSVLSEVESDAAMAYLGDDLTDEPAFNALGRRGLTVLVSPDSRPTSADAWIMPPEGLLAFLRDWASACERQPGI